MSTTNLNIRTDQAVKNQAEAIFSELGLNLTSAINIFLRAAIRQQGIPFDLKLENPNPITIAAIEEGRTILDDRDSPRYNSMESLKAALEI